MHRPSITGLAGGVLLARVAKGCAPILSMRRRWQLIIPDGKSKDRKSYKK